MASITPYDFIGTAVDAISNVIEFPATIFPRAYQKILFSDSIFNFYPYGEIFFKDEIGIVTDKIYFAEGFEWNFKLGSNDKQIVRNGKSEALGFLSHNYVWSEPQLYKTRQASHLSGIQAFILISALFMKDDYKSRITWNTTISDLVTSILKTDYGITDKAKLFITTTSGTDYWPQYSILNKQFLENLSMIAYNKTKSPFISFFNCAGEFYFMSLQDLFNQKSVGKYSLKFSETAVMDDYAIQDYKILHGGIPFNRDNYQTKNYFLEQDGTTTIKQANLKDYYLKPNSKDKFTVRNKYASAKNRSIDMGLKEESDNTNYLGKINNLFLNSNLTNRLELILKFNPKNVAGKVIEIEVDKSDNSAKASEFAGNWLICESYHYCDDNGLPAQKLIIAKPSVQINNKNPFFNEFI